MRYKNIKVKFAHKIIREDVDVFISHGDKYNSWHGVLYPPNNIGLQVGIVYTILIPEELPVRIAITSEAKYDGSITFRGVGVPPRSCTSDVSIVVGKNQ